MIFEIIIGILIFTLVILSLLIFLYRRARTCDICGAVNQFEVFKKEDGEYYIRCKICKEELPE